MKKYYMALLAVLALVFCGCQKSETSSTVSMYDLCQKMEAADSSLPEMLYASSAEENAEDLFTNISDLDYGKVESFFVSYAKEGGKADEIAVIAVKNANDAEAAKKSLEAHRENRRKLLDQYEPKEVSRINDGIIFTSGQYVVLVITDDPGAVRRAFEDAIKSEK